MTSAGWLIMKSGAAITGMRRFDRIGGRDKVSLLRVATDW
jgi:hypothetical protein